MGHDTSRANRVFSETPSLHYSLDSFFDLLGLGVREDAVGLGAPVHTARKFLAALDPEQTFIGKVGDEGLALGGARGRPGRQAGLAHGLGHLPHLLGAAAAVLDHALEEIGALLLPVD